MGLEAALILVHTDAIFYESRIITYATIISSLIVAFFMNLADATIFFWNCFRKEDGRLELISSVFLPKYLQLYILHTNQDIH